MDKEKLEKELSAARDKLKQLEQEWLRTQGAVSFIEYSLEVLKNECNKEGRDGLSSDIRESDKKDCNPISFEREGMFER
jgi:hypothetical protein